MIKTSYYVAVSLDGFLAREDEGMEWLANYMEPLGTPFDYEPFYKTVSAVIMGRKTFEKVISFGEYAYKGKPGLVLSTDSDFQVNEVGVEKVSSNWKEKLASLKASAESRVWLVGGGEVANNFIRENLLDEIILTIIPETLGVGIPWLGKTPLSAGWVLSEHYLSKKGVVQLVYSRR
ncbi:MAG: dihydrofolate reductase [Nitrospina sp.]|jgi:dihydrofolate reductase|nr:dihydrofolate reductase [Nitrospina sp.]